MTGGIGARHWAMALALAVGLHSAAFVAALWRAPPPGARAAGVAGLEISLGAAGGAPGGAASAAPADAAETGRPVKADRAATAAPRETPSPETPSPEISAREVETAAVLPRPEPPVEPVAVPVETPVEVPVEKAHAVEAPAAERVSVVRAPERPIERSVERRLERPVPVPQRKPSRPETQPAPQAQERPARAPAVPAGNAPDVPGEAAASHARPGAPGDGGKSGSGASAAAGRHDSSSGGGVPGAPPDYLARLRVWLDRHKEYPRSARTRREEGTAYLYFVIDREGKVLDFHLRKSSGHGSLDRATEEMIRRADPVPSPPASMAVARLEIVVPVQFQLR